MESGMVEVSHSFPSKTLAIGFLGTVRAKQVLLVDNGTDYKVVYASERSIVDGEVINKEEETPIITS